MSGAEDDIDLLAAEYVLGVLEGEEREDLRHRADRQPALSGAITAWEVRLAPLAAIVPPTVPPPGLWPRIETSCGLMAAPLSPVRAPARQNVAGDPAALWNRLGFWRWLSALGFGLAAAIAIVAVVDRPQTPAPGPAAAGIPIASAVIGPPKGGAPIFVAEAEPGKTLVLKPLTRVALATSKDLELWALPDGTTVPQSLGVISKAGQTVTVPASLHAPMQLLVSLERKGGSTTSLPQGPVLWAGHISALD